VEFPAAPRLSAWVRRHARGLSVVGFIVWMAPCVFVAVSMVHAMSRVHPVLLGGIGVGCAALTALLLRRKRP
jgi:hypothetical protein